MIWNRPIFEKSRPHKKYDRTDNHYPPLADKILEKHDSGGMGAVYKAESKKPCVNGIQLL